MLDKSLFGSTGIRCDVLQLSVFLKMSELHWTTSVKTSTGWWIITHSLPCQFCLVYKVWRNSPRHVTSALDLPQSHTFIHHSVVWRAPSYFTAVNHHLLSQTADLTNTKTIHSLCTSHARKRGRRLHNPQQWKLQALQLKTSASKKEWKWQICMQDNAVASRHVACSSQRRLSLRESQYDIIRICTIQVC